jgi:hypothetical protein
MIDEQLLAPVGLSVQLFLGLSFFNHFRFSAVFVMRRPPGEAGVSERKLIFPV